MPELQGGKGLSRVVGRLRSANDEKSEGGTVESRFHHLGDLSEFPGAPSWQRLTTSYDFLSFEIRQDSGELGEVVVDNKALHVLRTARLATSFLQSLGPCHVHS